jgi:hypothetical protein
LNNLKDYRENGDTGIDFNISNLEEKALETFQFQFRHNAVYKQYVRLTHRSPEQVTRLEEIPFLPVRFFKTHVIKTGTFEPEMFFESSGTTEMVRSVHQVKTSRLYRESFLKCFEIFYGLPTDWVILALLPSYLERKHSSLVYMADELIRLSHHPESGFYLNQYRELCSMLQSLEAAGRKTLLLGVTFALLDFAAAFPMELRHTIVMETGGMKGRKKELTRQEVYEQLRAGLGVQTVHSEYGMTELLSQAYAREDGLFRCPPWMSVILRAEDDPWSLSDAEGRPYRQGLINVIDLANRYSCSFIATDDIGVMHNNGSFEVTGRADNSDIRGCSLMAI